MYIINFDQVSTSESWVESIAMVAADDLTPLDAVLDKITMTLQVLNRLPRGYADQSQSPWYWPIQGGNASNFNPSINTSTGDGTGQLSLVSGVLSINIPAATMNQLSAGYYTVGISMKNADTIRQIAVGMLPLYDSGVFQ